MSRIVIKKKISFEELFCSAARSKIIKLLAKKEELNISKIINLTGLNHSNVESHLNYLQDIEIVQEKRFGKIRIFRFRKENIKARGIKNLINLIEM